MNEDNKNLRAACLDFISVSSCANLNLREMQRYLAVVAIDRQLRECSNNQSEAARRLGINRLTLRTYLKNANEPSTSESKR